VSRPPRRVAYVTSRFPKLSESFISNEIVQVERQGLDVDVYALVEEHEAVSHPEARRLAANTTYPAAGRLVADQLFWLVTSPRRYLHAWWRAVAGNLASPRFLARALVVMPTAASFARAIRERRTDHVHAHWATHSGLAAYLIHLLTDIPYSITAHAHDIHVDRTMLEEKLTHAAAVATISDFNRRQLADLYGDEVASKVHVIRCGVDAAVFASPDRTPTEALRVVMVASLERRKGHAVLLDACRALLDEELAVSVTLIGGGGEHDALSRRISELGLSDSVTLAGPQPRQVVADTLRDADVFVLPSITLESGKMEGIPVALMEAMATGLPVISTPMSGIPELVTDGVHGLLVDEGDVPALTAALRVLHGDAGLRSRMGVAGRLRVREDYDLVKNTRRLVELFEATHSPAGSR
jgi:colanic acid/amylovoran biosynthesis glycosyltransferase